MTSDRTARLVFRWSLPIVAVVFWVVGRDQWFIRDDWSFLLSRNALRETVGVGDWLFVPGSGHWMTVPILIYRLIEMVFGIDSYWPFLVVNMALHVGIVVAVRALMRRAGASEWTTTLVAVMLLLFGAGWENIVFAIQITYNLTLLCLFAQLLLVDHDGDGRDEVDRRDVLGSVLLVIGVMSSGFGPFAVLTVSVLLALRRRWRALAIAIGPASVLLAWWWLTWGDSSPEEFTPGPRSQVPDFAVRGVVAVFESFVGVPMLGGVAAVVTLAVAVRRGIDPRPHTLLLTLWLSVAAIYVGLGIQRVGFGIDSGTISRYQHVGAMFLAPAFAVTVDRMRDWSRDAHVVARMVVVIGLVLNIGLLRTGAAEWAERAQEERRILELVAGSPLAATVPTDTRPLPFSPDVTVGVIPYLVQHGAITPRTPVTPEEIAEVETALGLRSTPTP